MTFYPPKNLKDALRSVLVSSWIVGTGIIEYPPGHLRPFLTIFYGFCVLGAYTWAYYLSLNAMGLLDGGDISNQLYWSIVYFNIVLVISSTTMGFLRSKGLKKIITDLVIIDEAIKRLGIVHDYRSLFLKQTFVYIAIIVVTAIMSTINFFSTVDAVPLKAPQVQISLSIVIYYPIFQIMVVDFTYVNANMLIKEKFQHLNSLLMGLQTRYTKEFVRVQTPLDQDLFVISSVLTRVKVNGLSDVGEKSHRLRYIRGLHRNLSRIAKDVSSSYGPHLIYSSVLALIFIIEEVYSIYHIMIDDTLPEGTTSSVLIQKWFSVIVSGSKFFIMVHSSSALISEATRTGILLLQFHELNPKLRREVREFKLQLIQNPLDLTACGFWTLDYTIAQQFVGALVSYLVILIQMSNVSRS